MFEDGLKRVALPEQADDELVARATEILERADMLEARDDR
jgi:hypothetical protein